MHAEFVAISLISHVFESICSLSYSSQMITMDFDETAFESPLEQLFSLRKKNDRHTYVLPKMLPLLIKKYCNSSFVSGIARDLKSEEKAMVVEPGQMLIPLFRECTLFVSCEPCIMCAAALSLLGIILL
jgi:hypothetical protein